jgi:hypothetical protein
VIIGDYIRYIRCACADTLVQVTRHVAVRVVGVILVLALVAIGKAFCLV